MSDDKRLHDKLDKICVDISNIKVTQAVHTEQLTEHMRRTAILEEKLDKHELEDEQALKDINESLAPIKGLKWSLWFIGAVLGVLAALSKLL